MHASEWEWRGRGRLGGELGEWEESCGIIVPNDLEAAILEAVSEECTDDGQVELVQFPPSLTSVGSLDFHDDDPAGDCVDDEPVRLAPAHAAVVNEAEPRRGEVSRVVVGKESALDAGLVAESGTFGPFPRTLTREGWRVRRQHDTADVFGTAEALGRKRKVDGCASFALT